jgi:hypothetical protein
MGNDNWRTKLAALLSGVERAWAFKSRVALGAAITSVTALASLPSGTAQAKTEAAMVAPAEKPGKLSGKFVLERTKGPSGKAFAGHSSHSSHSSHRSHRSGAWVR